MLNVKYIGCIHKHGVGDFFMVLAEGVKVPHTSTSSWLVYNICKDDISDCSTPR